jgi:hypothetical protein
MVGTPISVSGPAIPDISIVDVPHSDVADESMFNIYKHKSYHSDEDQDMLSDLSSFGYVYGSSPCEPSPVPAGTKKPRTKASKRKPKAVAVASTQSYNGMPVSVLSASKKHECNFQHIDGSICRQKFQRVEHLKRHRAIHTSVENHVCPDPECGKKFRARADNLREHFKTHLRETSCKRNTSRTFEQFYRFIRDMYGAEGDKSIEKLEKWRIAGGHRKSDNAAAAVRHSKEKFWNSR